MFKLEIVAGSLKITKDGVVLLLYPKDSCAINVLRLQEPIPIIEIFNKYLANSTTIFSQPLSICEDSSSIPFDYASFVTFAETNLG